MNYKKDNVNPPNNLLMVSFCVSFVVQFALQVEPVDSNIHQFFIFIF